MSLGGMALAHWLGMTRPPNPTKVIRKVPETVRTSKGSPLPHERDESADALRARQAPSERLKLAHEDLEQGREDTDCRGLGASNKPNCPGGGPALGKPPREE